MEMEMFFKECMWSQDVLDYFDLECVYKLATKNFKWIMFLKGFWIEGFGWTLIFGENCHVHHFQPKFKVESLCKNHVFSTFHYHPICLFCSIILLWWIWSIGLSLDFTFTQKGIKLFKHKLTNSFHNHEILIFIPILFPIKMPCIFWICQTFFLWPSKDKYMFFFQKIANECHKLLCFTMWPHCFHWPTHLYMHPPTKLQSFHCSFLKDGFWCFLSMCLLHMVQRRFFQVYALYHFIQLLEIDHIGFHVKT